MLVYEVNLEVKEEAKFAFAGHIDQMLKFEGFKAAQWFFRNHEEEDREPDGSQLWTIQYIIESKDNLETYLKRHAPKMREEALTKFGDKFSATRRVLHLLSVAGSDFND
jgi:hypothetical protein